MLLLEGQSRGAEAPRGGTVAVAVAGGANVLDLVDALLETGDELVGVVDPEFAG